MVLAKNQLTFWLHRELCFKTEVPLNNDYAAILKRTAAILLIDWPDVRLPRTLLEFGYRIFGLSPNGFTTAELVQSESDALGGSVFAPAEGEREFLVFRRLDSPPQVDLIHVFRPAAELIPIINDVVPLVKAGALWLHPSISSVEARARAAEVGIDYVEGVDILEAIRRV